MESNYLRKIDNIIDEFFSLVEKAYDKEIVDKVKETLREKDEIKTIYDKLSGIDVEEIDMPMPADIDDFEPHIEEEVEVGRLDDVERNNKIRNIKIEEVHRGYMVDIGCHKFAISTHGELIEKLSEYLANPNETERKWFKGELF